MDAHRSVRRGLSPRPASHTQPRRMGQDRLRCSRCLALALVHCPLRSHWEKFSQWEKHRLPRPVRQRCAATLVLAETCSASQDACR